MTKRLPLATVHTTVFTQLNLRTSRARSLRFVLLLGLLSTTLALCVSSSASIQHLLFAKRVEAARTRLVSLPRQSLSVPSAQTPIDYALSIARRGHSATLLRNGKILIAGGENQNGFVTEAEVFDPSTNSFSVSGNLNVARADHSATLLPDGRVMIAGGRGAMGVLSSTEIFDPQSGAFTNGPSLNNARAGHATTTLSDGRTVFTGGDDRGTIEIYDSAANAFTSFSVILANPRAFHGAALLNDGRILIAGGTSPDGHDVKSGELIAIANNNIASVANNTEDEHIRPLLRVLPDGKVQIIGGSDHEVMEIYDPAINQFGAHVHVFPIGDSHPELLQQITDGPTRAALFRLGSTNVITNRARHSVTELSGSKHALIAGGVDSNGTILKAVSIVNNSTATITTDKLDYAPGTPVIVSGAGFQPNEVVTLTFHEDPHVDSENPHTFTVQTDANGDFSCQQYAPEDEDRGITYILAAIGGASGLTAQTSLTDGVPPTVSLTALGTSACENFNTLAITGTSSTTPNGWTFAESGTGANTTYAAGTGSSTTGDTYSFGAASNSERAFGELTTGTVNSTIGASFTNNTGQTITSLAISYTGEQWRLGALNRTDRLDFQYSTDATSLTTGTWTDVNALDFTAPVQGATTGALDGNASANRTSINATITGLNIANGANFWIRWNSIDAGSSDDGLAIDDFCLTPQGMAEVSVAVSPSAVDEDGAANLVYTFTRSSTSGGALNANFSVGGSATFNADYTQSGADSFTASAGTVTFAAGQSTTTVTIDPSSDNTVETDETVILSITPGAGYNIGSPSSATGTITNDDAAPTVQFASASSSGAESTSLVNLEVTLSNATYQTVTVNYAVNAGSTATGGADYTLAAGPLTFDPGETSKNISLSVNDDDLDEDDETLIVDLSSPANATLGGSSSHTYTIQDNDAAPIVQFALASSAGPESASPVNLTVNLSAPSGKTVTVNYAVNAGSTATGGGVDYTLTDGSLTFNPGETSRNISMTINDDNISETDETVIVDLSAPVNADIASPSSHTYLIQDNDAAPSFSIDDVTHDEGNSGTTIYTFTVSKSGTTALTANVDFTTTGSSASAASDYMATSGTLTFGPAENSKTITVLVNGDTTFENNETFFVNLSNADHATISDGQGLGTILNDDVEPNFSISDVTLNEGHSGTTSFMFTVSRIGATELPSSVNYQTMDGTALQPGDYQSNSGTLTFAANEPSKQIIVLIVGDTTYETNETFTVKLSNGSGASISHDEGIGTITNDDVPPSFAVNDVTMNEGTGSGTTAFTFTIIKNGATELPATVDFAAANGATDPATGGAACGAGTDYAFTDGTLTFAANETTKTATVNVCQDSDNETNETFFVNLSNAMQATIGDSQGIGTITNDDGAVSYLFEGFFAPIDRPPLINTTKAGSAVPVKWRLMTSDGAPVSDPTSFAELLSYAAECGSSSQLETPLETTAPGESSLTYLGDGNWQINWKTLSSYQKGSCRVLDLLLKDGTHHYANFKFK